MSGCLASMFAVLLLTDPEAAETVEVARTVVEVDDEGNAGGVLANAREAESITITSDRCDFDRADGVVFFDGHAHVDYSAGYTICGDRLFVVFTGTNEFDRLVCEGNVALTNGTRVGKCDRVVFRRKAGEIVMTGGARLAEQGTDEISGDSVRIMINTEQVEIDNCTLTFERGRGASKDIERLKSGRGESTRNE